MTRLATVPVLLLGLLTAACDDDDGGDASPVADGASSQGETTGVGPTSTDAGPVEADSDEMSDASGDLAPAQVPVTADALIEWIATEVYLEWPGESALHPSTGPHFGNVQTYISQDLFDSLESGAAEHPVGAAVVKELYGPGETLRGHAVMVKIEPGASGDTWYWFEVYDDRILADADGLGICVNCHIDGTDFVLTPFPLQ